MAVSPAVRQYYAKNIFAKSGRDSVPPNFAPLEVARTGFSSVEGCRGGGKNVLEVAIVGEDNAVKDVRMSCGLCNPAMYAAADIVAEWGRGSSFDDVLSIDPFDVAQPSHEYEVRIRHGGERHRLRKPVNKRPLSRPRDRAAACAITGEGGKMQAELAAGGAGPAVAGDESSGRIVVKIIRRTGVVIDPIGVEPIAGDVGNRVVEMDGVLVDG